MSRHAKVLLPVAVVLASLVYTGGASAAEPCPNEAIRIGQGATDLPDCRAWEMVTPAEKHGTAAGSASVIDGDHLGLVSVGAIFPDDPPFGATVTYTASRGAAGWDLVSRMLSPASELEDVNSDRSQLIFEDPNSLLPDEEDTPPGSPAGIRDVYALKNGQLSLVSTGSLAANAPLRAFYQGQSTDGSHILFASAESLEPADAGRVTGVQLYDRTGDETRVVGLKTDGSPVSPGGAMLAGFGSDAISGGFDGGQSNAVSADGSRIFFESPCSDENNTVGLECPPQSSEPTQLYLRENGQTTTRISGSQCDRVSPDPPCEDLGPARFWGASANGDVVLFATTAQLTDNDTNTFSDLYTYDVETGDLVDVTAGQQGATDCGLNLTGLCGVVAYSSDASRIYFVASGQIDGLGTPGARNLYSYDRISQRVDLIGVLGGNDLPNIPNGLSFGPSTASATPDGHYLVFASEQDLTTFHGEGKREVYRYDLVSHELLCVSCNPQGLPPLGAAAIPGDSTALGGGRAWVKNRYISADGSEVLFETGDALVARDTNGKIDVYLWRSGDLHLLTSGTNSINSAAVGLTPDGRDAFLTTNDRLLPADGDFDADLYDARVDGGFPETPLSPDGCSGESCQQNTEAPAAARPQSTSVRETAAAPRRCPKGKVRRAGKCVRRHPGKHRRHSANQNRRQGR